MFLGAPNPIQIQFASVDEGKPSLPPLILIHDSTGTTVSYFALSDLGRDMWAIHDPNHWEATPWEGGVDAMASHYVQLVKAAGILGPVILGGWSFGGYAAIAMARKLASETTSITTAGLLLIDSPYPFSDNPTDSTTIDTIGHDPAPLKNLPDLVQKSIARCDIILESWSLPTWERKEPKRDHHLPNHPTNEQCKDGQMTCVEQNNDVENADSALEPAYQPPAVLIRCKEFVDGQEDASNICLVDRHRSENLLGWENGYPGFIQAVIEVDANHYNIFDINNSLKMKNLTISLKEALTVLDRKVDQKASTS